MRRAFAAAGFAVALAFGTAALAENATAPLLPGDRLHGNILAPGDSDALEVFLPAGSTFSADLAAERGSGILPVLEVEPPAGGGPLDLSEWSRPGKGGTGVRVRNAPVPNQSGVYTFRVVGSQGTSGKYSLRVVAKAPRRLEVSDFLVAAAPGETAVTFGVLAGTRLSFAADSEPPGSPDLVVTSLEGPGGPVDFGGGTKAKKVLLPDAGVYDLRFQSTAEDELRATVRGSLKPPRASKRELYLSPAGFGEAPRVFAVEPARVLDDRPAEGLVITGENFDPGAEVRMVKKGQEPMEPAALEIVDGGTIHADFDVTAVRTGAWAVTVTNPSGGSGKRKLTVQAAGKVKLPSGAVPGTEVWWLDFDPATFPTDLELLGLGSTSSTVAAVAQNAVRSYTVFFARRAFGLSGLAGKVDDDDVPVSFVLGRPPATVGSPGSGYDRLRVGGQAAPGDPSTNPNYPWGDGPLDPGNAAYEDIGPDGGTASWGLKSRALAALPQASTAGWQAALAPLKNQPLTASDLIYFNPSFTPADAAQGTRYRDIAAALEAVGKELGGTIAHFVARAMGTEDSGAGLSAVPVLVGTYAAEANFAFSPAERAQMTTLQRPGIPGTSRTLLASFLPYRETRPYLLPDATTTKPYSEAFAVSGGRPDRQAGDLEFLGIAGSIPSGFTLGSGGVVSGTAPLYDPAQPGAQVLYGGVFRFVVRMRDTVNGEELLFSHRINLLVDAGNPALTPAQAALAVQKNQQTLNEP